MAIVKYPGEEWGGTVRFTYKGPGNIVQVYAGLRINPYRYWDIPLDWWIGKTGVICPTTIVDTIVEVPVSGFFPELEENQLVDVFKIIAWEPIDAFIGNQANFDRNLASIDPDAEVYVTPLSVFDIGRPESTWF